MKFNTEVFSYQLLAFSSRAAFSSSFKVMKMNLISLAFLCLLAIISPSACSNDQGGIKRQTPAGISKEAPPASAAVLTVKINFEVEQAQGVGLGVYKGDFRPQEAYVAPGNTVTWINNDDYWRNEHTVTSLDGLFEKELRFGESFNFTFTRKGTFEYYCKAFPVMTGKIIVD